VTASRSGHLPVDGLRLYCEVHGDPTAATAPPLLMSSSGRACVGELRGDGRLGCGGGCGLDRGSGTGISAAIICSAAADAASLRAERKRLTHNFG
jgi:hypothetical protein